jgi:hypothetical protein
MADLETRILLDGPTTAIVHLINATGSAETANTKVDVSTLSDVDHGVACAEVAIRHVKANAVGVSVKVMWDASADDLAFFVPKDASMDRCYDTPLVNPKSTDWTGDLKVTTIGAVASSTGYDIWLELEKRG